MYTFIAKSDKNIFIIIIFFLLLWEFLFASAHVQLEAAAAGLCRGLSFSSFSQPVSFFGHLSVHPVVSFCHLLCCSQSAPLPSHPITHTQTIKARLCVFVSPIVTIFSFLLFPARMLGHAAAPPAPYPRTQTGPFTHFS